MAAVLEAVTTEELIDHLESMAPVMDKWNRGVSGAKEAAARLRKLEEALKWYADAHVEVLVLDRGQRARDAL